jgi:hypothetical protein
MEGSPEDRFDLSRGLWTLTGCALTVLMWAVIIAASGFLGRGQLAAAGSGRAAHAGGRLVRPYARPVRSWAAVPSDPDPTLAAAFAAAVVEAGIPGLLVLLGRRLTPGSVTGSQAIPPTSDVLMADAASPHRPGVRVCKAARALAGTSLAVE